MAETIGPKIIRKEVKSPTSTKKWTRKSSTNRKPKRK